MSKLKIEIFFSMILMLFCWVWGVLFLYLMINNLSFIISWEIFSFLSCFVELEILFDWVSCSFSSLVCLISSSVCLFSVSYMKEDINSKRFIIILMFFVMSMNFLIFIPSIVSLILGWDGLGLVSFCLVIYYQNNKSLSAGMLTVLLNRVGDCFILGGISMVMIGHWNYLCIWWFNYFEVCMFFMVIAGMTKSAQIPFSSWLPAAMAAPTPVSALVHSSTLVTAGVYLLIRFYDNFLSVYFFFPFLLFFSIMTTLMSGICAIFENDMKKIIALSTLSQLGVMMMSLSMGLPMLSLFHLYTHAMFKALLFLCGGNIIHNYNGMQDIRDIKGVIKSLPFTGVIMNICNMALCGFPFLAGFYSKDMIIEMMLSSEVNFFMMFMCLLGVCLTLLYSMRMSLIVMWGDSHSMNYENMSDDDNMVIISMLFLVGGALFGGYMYQNLVLCFYSVVILPMSYKLIVNILLLICFIISMSNWMFENNKKTKSLFLWMNSKMWFLSSLSSYPFIMSVKMMSNKNLKLVDMGWFEIIGGQGIFMIIMKVFSFMEWWMLTFFNIYLIVFIMMIFLL
uniref:NADH dehydrogenase subunit 5 n=1 Tax=Argonauta argo TaxID=294695 RepID=UPI0022FD80F8|nr:NADH dehydrogenase subunit 5 [Argonauta argo]WAP91597.1 NADH dehydrogenase subunit 5 [Argonauta argo]